MMMMMMERGEDHISIYILNKVCSTWLVVMPSLLIEHWKMAVTRLEMTSLIAQSLMQTSPNSHFLSLKTM